MQEQSGPDGEGPKVAEKWRGLPVWNRYDRPLAKRGTVERPSGALALAKRDPESKAKRARPHLAKALPDKKQDRVAMEGQKRDDDELRREFIKSRRRNSWQVSRKGPY